MNAAAMLDSNSLSIVGNRASDKFVAVSLREVGVCGLNGENIKDTLVVEIKQAIIGIPIADLLLDVDQATNI